MKCYVKVRVNDVDRTVEWREVEAEDLDQAVKVVERMPDVVAVHDSSTTAPSNGCYSVVGKNPGQIEQFTGDLQAMGGIKGMVCYVRVRLADVERSLVWREVQAETLDAAIKVAEAMEDVEVCLEASITPGGVVT